MLCSEKSLQFDSAKSGLPQESNHYSLSVQYCMYAFLSLLCRMFWAADWCSDNGSQCRWNARVVGVSTWSHLRHAAASFTCKTRRHNSRRGVSLPNAICPLVSQCHQMALLHEYRGCCCWLLLCSSILRSQAGSLCSCCVWFWLSDWVVGFIIV